MLERESITEMCQLLNCGVLRQSRITEILFTFRRSTIQQRGKICKLTLSGKIYLLHNVKKSSHCTNEVGNLHVNIGPYDKLVCDVLSDVIVVVTSVFKW